jgi:hypothetical protein
MQQTHKNYACEPSSIIFVQEYGVAPPVNHTLYTEPLDL